MKQLTVFVLILLFFCSSAAFPQPAPTDPYIAMIVTRNLRWMLHQKEKYQFDYECAPLEWDQLPAELDQIVSKAGTRPIVLDLYVHGNDAGLYLVEQTGTIYQSEEHSDRASFGWVANLIKQKFAGHHFMVMTEACYSGRAYKNTIRGGTMQSPYDNIEDCPGVPSFPIFGTGDSFSAVGPIMYLQWKHNFRRFWVDLREYDPLGKDKPLSLKEPCKYKVGDEWYSQTTLKIKRIWEFFREEIP